MSTQKKTSSFFPSFCSWLCLLFEVSFNFSTSLCAYANAFFCAFITNPVCLREQCGKNGSQIDSSWEYYMISECVQLNRQSSQKYPSVKENQPTASRLQAATAGWIENVIQKKNVLSQ